MHFLVESLQPVRVPHITERSDHLCHLTAEKRDRGRHIGAGVTSLFFT